MNTTQIETSLQGQQNEEQKVERLLAAASKHIKYIDPVSFRIGAQLAIIEEWREKALLHDILAIIHRDGGQRTEQVGVQASAEEALTIIHSQLHQ